MSTNHPARMGPRSLSTGSAGRRLSRETSRALAHVHKDALVSAAHVQAAGYVTHVAMSEVGIISLEEALVVEHSPHAAGRAKLLADAFTMAAAAEITRWR